MVGSYTKLKYALFANHETNVLVIGNPSTTEAVSYHLEYEVAGGIPGFTIVFLIFALLSLLGILLLRRSCLKSALIK